MNWQEFDKEIEIMGWSFKTSNHLMEEDTDIGGFITKMDIKELLKQIGYNIKKIRELRNSLK